MCRIYKSPINTKICASPTDFKEIESKGRWMELYVYENEDDEAKNSYID